VIFAALLLLQESSKIAQEIEVANAKDRPQLQPVAVKRLQERGGAAVADDVARFVKARGHNALSLAFTEGLGGLKDERITKVLQELVADADFFWRPAAMRALADHGDARSLEEFRHGLSDRLWGCRAATIAALEKLGDRASMPRLRELLNDEVYDVRAQAAKTLHAFGDDSGLPVLVEALRADTQWFDIDYGQIAREDAWNFLKKLAKDDFGFKPWDGAAARAAGLAKFDGWMSKRDPEWRSKVPEKARVRPETATYVFGFERRSCQKGDFFFRVDAEGNLVLGFFNLERAKLSPEELAAFNRALEKVKAVDRSVPYGQGGCDFEQYYLRVGDRFEKLWVGLRGRPHGIEGWNKVVLGLIREKFGEGAAHEFKETALLFQMED
jgi:hypothetical protein